MTPILRWLFNSTDGYEVIQEDHRGDTIPDHVVFKIARRAGASFYLYDFLICECKKAGVSWTSAKEQCQTYCETTENESDEVYGMVQVGMELRFYSWRRGYDIVPLSNKLHIRQDVQEIIQWPEHLKANPLPLL